MAGAARMLPALQKRRQDGSTAKDAKKHSPAPVQPGGAMLFGYRYAYSVGSVPRRRRLP